MKYIGIPLGMWVLFEKSFRKNLVSEFGYNKITAKQISKNAKSRYKSIIRNSIETSCRIRHIHHITFQNRAASFCNSLIIDFFGFFHTDNRIVNTIYNAMRIFLKKLFNVRSTAAATVHYLGI